MRNIIYLVEETHLQEAKSFGWETIQTALVQIQVREKFFLKRVLHSEESVEYLVAMTEQLKELYLVSLKELLYFF